MKAIFILLVGLTTSIFPFFKTFGLNSEELLPSHFYSAEKDGKKHYFLGTLHIGISLDDISCVSQIEQTISNSDLYFSEKSYYNLSARDQLIFITSSQEDKERILSKLPIDLAELLQEYISTQREPIINLMIDIFFKRKRFVIEGEASFENLSLTARNFILSKGGNLNDSLLDNFYTLMVTSYYEAYWSLYPEMLDHQVSAIAFSQKDLPMQALDDDDGPGYSKPLPANKPQKLVSSSDFFNM